MKYRTREGDMLDQICLAYYGRVGVIAQVLEVNPALVEHGPVFQAGLIINLPKIEKATSSSEVQLWD